MLDIGVEVKILRERLKMSAKELAERIGLSQSQMSRLEKGQRRVDTRILEKIAQALEVEPSYFFQGAGELREGVIPPTFPAELGKLVRTERRKRHVSAEDLASRLGIPKVRVQQIEEGKRELDAELAERVAKILRLPPGFFLAVQQERIHHLQAQVARLHQALAEESRGQLPGAPDGAGERRGIPVLGTLVGGYPNTFDGLGRPAAEAEDFLFLPTVTDAQAFALHVVGESMQAPTQPSFAEGDLVVFSSGILRSRDFAFVRLADEPPVFRQVFFDPSSQVRLQPLNLNFPSRSYRREQILAMWRLVAHVASY